jgi:hypothetical protein
VIAHGYHEKKIRAKVDAVKPISRHLPPPPPAQFDLHLTRARLQKESEPEKCRLSSSTVMFGEVPIPTSPLVTVVDNAPTPLTISSNPNIINGVDMNAAIALSKAYAYHHAVHIDNNNVILDEPPKIDGINTQSPKDQWYLLQQPRAMKYGKQAQSKSQKKKIYENTLRENVHKLRVEYQDHVKHLESTGKEASQREQESDRQMKFLQMQKDRELAKLQFFRTASNRYSNYLEFRQIKDKERIQELMDKEDSWKARIKLIEEDKAPELTLFEKNKMLALEKELTAKKENHRVQVEKMGKEEIKKLDTFFDDLERAEEKRRKEALEEKRMRRMKVKKLQGSIKNVRDSVSIINSFVNSAPVSSEDEEESWDGNVHIPITKSRSLPLL